MVKNIKNEAKIKLRVDDTVIVNSGVDAGKKGKILKVLRGTNKVVVQGVNIRTKHTKPRRQGEQGGIVKVESPIHVSKVNYYCDKCGKGVKLGVQVKDGKKIRVCRKCNTEIK